MVYLHNRILRSREKEGAYTLCNSMDGTESIMLSEINQAVRDKYHMISPLTSYGFNFLNLLRLVLCQIMWYIFENFPCAFENNVHFTFWWKFLYIYVYAYIYTYTYKINYIYIIDVKSISIYICVCVRIRKSFSNSFFYYYHYVLVSGIQLSS